MNFEQWMTEVDKLFVKTFGLDSGCFEDWLYYDAYEDGLTPKEAFKTYVEENDLDDYTNAVSYI